MKEKALLLFAIILLVNCSSQKDVAQRSAASEKSSTEGENIIYLKEGENKFLKEYQMNVTFRGISEDSRCPQGTQCIWSGVAVADIELMSTTSRPVMVRLSTQEVAGKDYYKSHYFNGYKISLMELTPYPTEKSNVKSLPGQYKIGISLTKDLEIRDTTTTR
ncbi:hypothetical protein GSF70_05200 [Flavobacteriaceae bacterium W22]|uniref:hypothetical protein n=1 Tax=Chryseobacterium binzhouense TaxID=2593646 RepID=UPI00136F1746|nr:hypothetical protein [Chryseobacterium binzhouense]MXS70608.1 hypothetical protein [Flavobacteriaceae bacterium W22]